MFHCGQYTHLGYTCCHPAILYRSAHVCRAVTSHRHSARHSGHRLAILCRCRSWPSAFRRCHCHPYHRYNSWLGYHLRADHPLCMIHLGCRFPKCTQIQHRMPGCHAPYRTSLPVVYTYHLVKCLRGNLGRWLAEHFCRCSRISSMLERSLKDLQVRSSPHNYLGMVSSMEERHHL
jgi:hypothetical protein